MPVLSNDTVSVSWFPSAGKDDATWPVVKFSATEDSAAVVTEDLVSLFWAWSLLLSSVIDSLGLPDSSNYKNKTIVIQSHFKMDALIYRNTESWYH